MEEAAMRDPLDLDGGRGRGGEGEEGDAGDGGADGADHPAIGGGFCHEPVVAVEGVSLRLGLANVGVPLGASRVLLVAEATLGAVGLVDKLLLEMKSDDG